MPTDDPSLLARLRRALARLFNWFTRHGGPVLAGLGLGLLVFGFLGIRRVSNGDRWPLSFLYEIVQIATFNEDASRFNGNLFSQAAAACAVLLAIGTTFHVLVKAMDSTRLFRLKMLRRSTGRGHVVVCGLGQIGERLVRHCLGQKLAVVAIEANPDNPDIRTCRKAGCLVIVGDAKDPEALDGAQVAEAEDVFIVTGSDAVNLDIALAMCLPHKGEPAPAHLPRCHVHLTDPNQVELLRDTPLFRAPDRRADVRVFNMIQATARNLIKRLATRAPDGERVAHYVLLGFGPMGQTIALQAARQAHYRNCRRLRLTIVDDHIAPAREAFLARYPAFCPDDLDLTAAAPDVDQWASRARRPSPRAQVADPGIEYVCNAEFLPSPPDIDDHRFIDALKARLADERIAGEVIICFEYDDPRNFETALRLRYRLDRLGLSRVPISVWLPRLNALTHFLDPAVNTLNIEPFGLALGTYRMEDIIEADIDKLAEQIHTGYRTMTLSTSPDRTIPSWFELTREMKESNRQQCEHLDIKLLAAGCCRRTRCEDDGANGTGGAGAAGNTGGDGSAGRAASAGGAGREGGERGATRADHERGLAQLQKHITALAQMEHNRWTAERLLAGWRYAPDNDRPNLISRYLVPWALLDDKIRAYDIEAVHAIPLQLETRRERIVVVEARSEK